MIADASLTRELKRIYKADAMAVLQRVLAAVPHLKAAATLAERLNENGLDAWAQGCIGDTRCDAVVNITGPLDTVLRWLDFHAVPVDVVARSVLARVHAYRARVSGQSVTLLISDVACT